MARLTEEPNYLYLYPQELQPSVGTNLVQSMKAGFSKPDSKVMYKQPTAIDSLTEPEKEGLK
jgi:hypothetical protein